MQKQATSLAALVMALAASSAAAETYQVFDPPDGQATTALVVPSINSQGDVVGSSRAGFIRRADGTMSAFDIPGNAGLVAGINAAGTVAGVVTSPEEQGFIRTSDGAITLYAGPTGRGAMPLAINAGSDFAGEFFDPDYGSAGFLKLASDSASIVFTVPDAEVGVHGMNDLADIVGEARYYGSSNFTRGLIRRHDGSQTLFFAPPSDGERPHRAPGGNYTVASAINGGGTVAGYAYHLNCLVRNEWYCVYQDVRSYVRSADGTFTVFRVSDPPRYNIDGRGTYAHGINAAGAVVGTHDVAHGFLRDPSGAITTFDVPGMVKTEPAAINDDGIITGTCTDAQGYMHGFMRLP